MSLLRLEDLLVELASSLLQGDGDAGVVGVTAADVALPCEATLGEGALLHASVPRGRLRTGFDPSLHRLRFTVAASAGSREVR